MPCAAAHTPMSQSSGQNGHRLPIDPSAVVVHDLSLGSEIEHCLSVDAMDMNVSGGDKNSRHRSMLSDRWDIHI